MRTRVYTSHHITHTRHTRHTHTSHTHTHTLTEYGDWDEDEIECLKEGLRKFGRAWGKIYREVGGRKTATQCKQFYDTHCTIEKLGLLKALADHSSMKVGMDRWSVQHVHMYVWLAMQ